MPKLTMDDVDKRLDEIRAWATKRPNIASSLVERAKGRLPRLPRQPKLPKV